MPIATLVMLAQSVATDLWRTQMRTYRAKVHEAGEDDDPDVLGVDNIATVKLRESVLGALMAERSVKRRTDQKTIG